MALIDDIHATVHRIESYVLFIRSAIADLGRYTGGDQPYTVWAKTLAELNDPVHGLANLKTKLDSIQGAGAHSIADVMAALSPVTLPSTPPAGYGGASAAEVWNYNLLNVSRGGGETADGALSDTVTLLQRLGMSAMWPVTEAPYFLVSYEGTANLYWQDSFAAPRPDFSDVLPGESVVDWLNRTDATLRTWAVDSASGVPVTYDILTGEKWYAIYCILTFEKLHPTSLVAAPIWPGAAGVVEGTPVAITGPTIISGPMDGIEITLDTANPGAGKWQVDTFESWRYAGYVVFLSPEGHADVTQFLGPADNVFCPKTMNKAGSCVVYLNKILTATVTPWTLA